MLATLFVMALSAAPTGSLDAGTASFVGGWARDPDYPAPIPVHIYIDGHLAHTMVADGPRPDLPFADQAHGYSWVPPIFGPGSHQIVAYAIGVDENGIPDGDNVGLPGSPATFTGDCSGFSGSARVWCDGVPNYYVQRAADTKYLYNDQIRVGVSPSYGGTIFELYGRDHSRNLILEHGGAAVQLSVWGYDPVGEAKWFGTGINVCDYTPYDTQAECTAVHATCQVWAASGGAQATTGQGCCGGWGAAAPFNPIQAQAAGCGWDGPSNDVDNVATTANSVTVSKLGPYNFTKPTAFAGMTFSQTTSLLPAYVRVDYRLTYSGPYTLTPHPQEIPAIFSAFGIDDHFYAYLGTSPWTGDGVTQWSGHKMLRFEGRGPYLHAPLNDGYVTEQWVSACDVSSTNCLTVAAFSPQFVEWDVSPSATQEEGYLTPLGAFAIKPGMDEQVTVYLFPARYDEVVAGKTVREHIKDLAAANGCYAYGYACDDGDACTVADRCDGNGACSSGAPKCDDGDPCTTDTCTPGSGACQHTAIPGCQCGDGVLQGGETCDPPGTCPTTCTDGNACTVDTMQGSAVMCSVRCDHAVVTACANGDGCCPSGCDSTHDDDCALSCGNGVVEANETCDPPETCPTSCDDGDACTIDLATGGAASCSAACTHNAITSCGPGDGCCPAGCSVDLDDDCAATPSADAGMGDAAGTEETPRSGCGCQTSPGEGVPSALPYLAMLLVRRWRGRRRGPAIP